MWSHFINDHSVPGCYLSYVEGSSSLNNHPTVGSRLATDLMDYHEFDDWPAGLPYSIFCGGSVVESDGYGCTSDAGLYFQLFRKEPFDCAGGGAANNPESHSSR